MLLEEQQSASEKKKCGRAFDEACLKSIESTQVDRGDV